MIADLDHFKEVNDTYGHDAGDLVLKEAVNKLKELTGLHICRWGGEEFAVFDDKGRYDQDTADKLCSDFGKLVVKYNNVLIPVHCSIGVVTTSSADLTSVSQLIKTADECLYEAKETGRNKAVVKGMFLDI